MRYHPRDVGDPCRMVGYINKNMMLMNVDINKNMLLMMLGMDINKDMVVMNVGTKITC